MKAWLLTWECNIVQVKERLVAILSSRKSDRAIMDLMEFIVLRATSAAESNAYYANRGRELVYKAQSPLSINRVPHGGRIICGHDPWLYGRQVTDLKVEIDPPSGEEIVSWQEPDDFRWTDPSLLGIEIASKGQQKSLRRRNVPLSADIHAP